MKHISRAERAASDAIVQAIHPGGAALAPAPFETPAQRLARQESELLELAIEENVHRGGPTADLAVSIIALRAVVAG